MVRIRAKAALGKGKPKAEDTAERERALAALAGQSPRVLSSGVRTWVHVKFGLHDTNAVLRRAALNAARTVAVRYHGGRLLLRRSPYTALSGHRRYIVRFRVSRAKAEEARKALLRAVTTALGAPKLSTRVSRK